jgi:hypothetical protein
MVIYLAAELLRRSSDLTRPDTDVFASRNFHTASERKFHSKGEQPLDRDLFDLAPRRDYPVSPELYELLRKIRLVSVALYPRLSTDGH